MFTFPFGGAILGGILLLILGVVEVNLNHALRLQLLAKVSLHVLLHVLLLSESLLTGWALECSLTSVNSFQVTHKGELRAKCFATFMMVAQESALLILYDLVLS